MIEPVTSGDTERFRAAIARRLGLHFDETKLAVLGDVLRRRAASVDRSAEAYLASLETDSFDDEVGALAQELTVSETYFFRHKEQFRALTEAALPDRMRVQNVPRCLRILSAGCASGEEAYSLAILARETLDPSWDVSIVAVDANPAMVKKATQGRYAAWALRETPPDVQRRWLRPEGREFVVDNTLRSIVKFEARNLAEDHLPLWKADSYDIVFFRNVLMYFTHEQGQAIIARIGRALKPGGYLFLGHAETLRGLSGAFHLQHTHETFYYRRKGRLESGRSLPPQGAPSGEADEASTDASEANGNWIEAIGRATARIETLTRPDRVEPVGQESPRPLAAAAWDLGLAFDLLREERFTEASELLGRFPAASGRDPDVLLLSAALLTHRGRWAEAEQTCHRLLDVDELSAGAHYLLALCCEGALDWPGALNHHQLAIYLDPGFAMPRLRLGLLARQAGDPAAAQRELRHAETLLQREDVSRLLLFGGGFSRDALIALCRTELVRSGDQP
jgi:chemotaxis protein methyltransferase CheR